MMIAEMILREYHIGCTPRELFWRMSWFEILSLLYTKKERLETPAKKQKKEEIKHENGKTIRVITKPIAYFKRKGS